MKNSGVGSADDWIFRFVPSILPSPLGKVSSIARRMGGAKHNGTACTRVVREADPYAMHLVGDGVLDIPVCKANNHRRWFPWLSLWESCHQRGLRGHRQCPEIATSASPPRNDILRWHLQPPPVIARLRRSRGNLYLFCFGKKFYKMKEEHENVTEYVTAVCYSKATKKNEPQIIQ